MAVTFTITSQAVGGKAPSAPLFADRVNVAFTSTYTTGGDAFDPSAAIGAGKTILAIPDQILSDGRVAHYDRATAKLQVFETPASGPLAETSGGTDLTGVSGELLIISQ